MAEVAGQKLLRKMDTNKMLIHRRLQVAPLPLLSSGGLSVPTPLPCVSPRELLGDRRLLLSPQRGCGPPHWPVFVCPRAWYSSSDLNICKCCNGALSKETPTTTITTTTMFFFCLPTFSPLFFLFVSSLTAVGGLDSCGNQICFVTGIYFKRGLRLMTVNYQT